MNYVYKYLKRLNNGLIKIIGTVKIEETIVQWAIKVKISLETFTEQIAFSLIFSAVVVMV
jgi:hypothetical protein